MTHAARAENLQLKVEVSPGFLARQRLRLDAEVDLRTAAIVNAIKKVGVTYEELGIFP